MENKATFSLTGSQVKLRKKLLNPFWFRLLMVAQVPMVFLAGIKLTTLSDTVSATTIPFKFLNKNPFKSIYFAAQSMAAELSTAAPILLAVDGQKPSIAFILVDLQVSFYKKAVGKTTFTCSNVAQVFEAVAEAVSTGEGVKVPLRTVGTLADGTVVSEFTFTWSMKQRKRR